MRGETFEHTTFEVSFLKNKFNNICFSPLLGIEKAINFIFKEAGAGGGRSPDKILPLPHPQQKLQGTEKENYQFSKSVEQIIKVSEANDCQKKKSQFASMKTEEDKISYHFLHVVCRICKRTVCRSLNYFYLSYFSLLTLHFQASFGFYSFPIM